MDSVCIHRLVHPFLFELIDTLHRLQLPVSIMVVMETMFGVTDAFVAIRIRQTTRDTHTDSKEALANR